MEAAVSAGCDCILNDGDFDPLGGNGKTGHSFLKKMRFICVLPPVFHVNNRERIRQQILTASEKGYSGILVRTLEELSLALQAGYEGEIIADASLYSWNGRSMAALSGECDRIVCPLELNQGGILDAIRAADQRQPAAQGRIMDKIILPVYGRIPMMESAGCVRKTENMCTRKDGFWYIEDRRGMQLPVRCRCGICSNTIYNAVPLSLHQFAGRGLYREAPVHLCMFTTENADQTREILQFFGSLRKESGSFPDLYGKKPSADPAVNGSAIKSGKVSGKTSGNTSKKTSAKTSGKASGKRGVTAEQKARAPFELFTNGHYETGAL
jgi:putative protease